MSHHAIQNFNCVLVYNLIPTFLQHLLCILPDCNRTSDVNVQTPDNSKLRNLDALINCRQELH